MRKSPKIFPQTLSFNLRFFRCMLWTAFAGDTSMSTYTRVKGPFHRRIFEPLFILGGGIPFIERPAVRLPFFKIFFQFFYFLFLFLKIPYKYGYK